MIVNQDLKLWGLFTLFTVSAQAGILKSSSRHAFQGPRNLHEVENRAARSPNMPSVQNLDERAVSCPCGYKDSKTGMVTMYQKSLDPRLMSASNDIATNLGNQGWQPDVFVLGSTPRQANYITNNIRYNSRTRTLELVVDPPASSSSTINSGEISTIENDILYGSFSFSVKASKVPGACHGLFFYKDDNHEIDIELLTSYVWTNDGTDGEPDPGIQLTVQPLTTQQGNTNYDVEPYTFDPTKGYHTYRFDWTSQSVNYYVDGCPVQNFNQNIPTAPGSILINNWSDGDPNWTAGPPTTSNVLSVQKVNMYYNVTGSAATAFSKQCKAAKNKALCPAIQ